MSLKDPRALGIVKYGGTCDVFESIISITLLCFIAITVLIPVFVRGTSNAETVEHNLELFYNQSNNQDLIGILEDQVESEIARLDLLAKADNVTIQSPVQLYES